MPLLPCRCFCITWAPGVSSLRQRHAPPPQVHRVARARCGRRPTLPQPWVRASDLSSRPSSRVGMFPSEAVHELRVLYRALHCHRPRFGSTSGECGPAITRMPELVRWVSFGRHAHGGWRNGSCRAQRMAAHDSDGDNRSGSRAEDLVLLARAVTRTGVRRQCTRVNWRAVSRSSAPGARQKRHKYDISTSRTKS